MSHFDEVRVRQAQLFATVAHAAIGQVRKYTGEPYIEHPAAVVATLRRIGWTEDENSAGLAAAWLHDVVEDTHITIGMVCQHFGSEVACLVTQLTDKSRPEDGNRAVRRAIDREHLAGASAEAQTIKLADLLDNTRTIAEYDPGFAKVYMREKALLLPLLSRGDGLLWMEARRILDAYFEQ